MKLIVRALPDCILSRVTDVSRFLETSKDSQTLRQGQDYRGDTALVMAAAKECPTMVVLLIDEGAQLNRCNARGRSALMESALWDRAENPQILIQYGADKTIKDSGGRKAADLAATNDKLEGTSQPRRRDL